MFYATPLRPFLFLFTYRHLCLDHEFHFLLSLITFTCTHARTHSCIHTLRACVLACWACLLACGVCLCMHVLCVCVGHSYFFSFRSAAELEEALRRVLFAPLKPPPLATVLSLASHATAAAASSSAAAFSLSAASLLYPSSPYAGTALTALSPVERYCSSYSSSSFLSCSCSCCSAVCVYISASQPVSQSSIP